MSTSCKLCISICTFLYITLYICINNIVLPCYLNSCNVTTISILCLLINIEGRIQEFKNLRHKFEESAIEASDIARNNWGVLGAL